MMPYSHKQMVSATVTFFTMVVETLLALRVVLRFFNGNPDATFVHWVYTQTGVLLEPIRAVFTSTGVMERGWVVDFQALFAMLVYGAFAVLLMGWVHQAKDK